MIELVSMGFGPPPLNGSSITSQLVDRRPAMMRRKQARRVIMKR
jgi:hypothetical protein